jgi:hypothetical protein
MKEYMAQINKKLYKKLVKNFEDVAKTNQNLNDKNVQVNQRNAEEIKDLRPKIEKMELNIHNLVNKHIPLIQRSDARIFSLESRVKEEEFSRLSNTHYLKDILKKLLYSLEQFSLHKLSIPSPPPEPSFTLLPSIKPNKPTLPSKSPKPTVLHHTNPPNPILNRIEKKIFQMKDHHLIQDSALSHTHTHSTSDSKTYPTSPQNEFSPPIPGSDANRSTLSPSPSLDAAVGTTDGHYNEIMLIRRIHQLKAVLNSPTSSSSSYFQFPSHNQHKEKDKEQSHHDRTHALSLQSRTPKGDSASGKTHFHYPERNRSNMLIEKEQSNAALVDIKFPKESNSLTQDSIHFQSYQNSPVDYTKVFHTFGIKPRLPKVFIFLHCEVNALIIVSEERKQN